MPAPAWKLLRLYDWLTGHPRPPKAKNRHDCAEAGCVITSRKTGLASIDGGKTWFKAGPTWPVIKKEEEGSK